MGDARDLIEHVGERGRRRSKLVNEHSGLVGKTEERLERDDMSI